MPLEQLQARPQATFKARHGSGPAASVADMLDQEIHDMDREELIALLNCVPSPSLERRVKRRLKHFDVLTLRRLLFLCRRCERNLVQLRARRAVPTASF